MIRVLFVVEGEHRDATMPAPPREGDRLVFEPGLPIEYEVESMRWVLRPADAMDRGMPYQTTRVVAFLRLVGEVA